jgi:hypothetical protein
LEISHRDLRTVAVDLAGGAGDTTVLAASVGLRWGIVFMSLGAVLASSVIVKSGTTALTGTLPIAAGQTVTFGDGEAIVLVSRAVNEALVMDPGAADVDGFVQVVTLQG